MCGQDNSKIGPDFSILYPAFYELFSCDSET